MDDPISKALERAQGDKKTVKDWVRPEPDATKKKRAANPRKAATVAPADHDALRVLGNEVELDLEHLLRGNVLTGTNDENPNVADRYKLLRTRVRQRMEPRDWNCLGITSPAAKEGKSLSSINLAITTARDGRAPVVLIDADFRRPSMAKYLGINTDHDLVEYLNGEAEINDIVYRPSHEPNLLVIPNQLSDSNVNISAGQSSRRLSALIEQLGNAGALIIVDLPPALVADDVLTIAPLLNTLIIVVREGQTNLNELEQTIELLQDVDLLGTILNDSVEGNNVYGYYVN